MKYGFNIDASQAHIPLDDIRRVNAPYHLVMTAPPGGISDNNALAQIDRYQQALPNSQLVWRTYNAHEGNWSKYEPAATIIARWNAEGRKHIIRDDPCNEPNIGNDAAYVARCVELLDRAADAGFRVAIGAFSVGTPHHDAIQRGVYDPMLQAIARGNHFLSYHSYGHGIPDVGELRPLDALTDPKAAYQGMIRKRWEVRTGYWYLRRSDWFVMRARQLGLPDTPTLMTEACFDQINVNPALMDNLRRTYGMPEYLNDLRGVLSWEKYWNAAQAHLQDIMEYLADYVYYPDYIKGVMLFAINRQWRAPQGHDWGAGGSTMINMIRDVNYAVKQDPVYEPQPEPVQPDVTWHVELVSPVRGAVNIRKEPSTSAPVVAKLATDRTEIEVSPRTRDTANYVFQEVRLNGVRGWVAREVVRWHGKPVADTIAQIRRLLDELEKQL
jgi:hypothetical protein